MDGPWTGETHFASAARADAPTLAEQRRVWQSVPLLQPMLEAVPGMAFVLNRQRQIISANARAVDLLGLPDDSSIVGRRPGELFGCLVAQQAPSGCGTGRECAFCGAVAAILAGFETRGPASRECRLRTSVTAGGGAFEIDVQASYLPVEGTEFLVLGLRDLSDEKRRRLLERAFFHDVMNTAGGVLGVSEILHDIHGPDEESDLKEDLVHLSNQLIDEITAQRQLVAAEAGELRVAVSDTYVPMLLLEVAAICRHHDAASEREVRVGTSPAMAIHTDLTLLKRVLGNLVKNALEATARGGQVQLSAEALASGHVAFHVRNDGVMTDEVQAQIFQRSFSTKGGSGRGIGTFSVRLLTERYLGGQVSFVSDAASGTVFTVAVPSDLAAD